jgi:cell division septation protein DedD
MDDLISKLNDSDPEIRKLALIAVSQVSATPELLFYVEKMAAQDEDKDLRAAALEALNVPNLRALRAQRLMKVGGNEQRFILQELETWQKQGLIGEDLANTLRSRYRITFKPAPAPAAQTGTPAPPAPAPAKPAESTPPAAPAPRPEPRPRQSLAQTLLSETSIKTFLYLGAFFVISAAIILAALVETLRLPILSLAVLAFGASAIALKKRLPQPSFVLFIVFSFLLPINAGVFADLLKLQDQALAAYWTFVLLSSAGIWAFATWFYNSRFFTLTTLGAFIWSGWNLPGILAVEPAGEYRLMALQLTNLTSLAGIVFLIRKKDWKFSFPTFLAGQLFNLFLFAALGIYALVDLAYNEPGWTWLALAFAALLCAGYYAASNLVRPFLLYPWLATAAFSPVLYFGLNAIAFAHENNFVFAIGWAAWAVLLTALSEIAYRIAHLSWLQGKTKEYPLPLSLAGIALFLVGSLWGLFVSVSWGFAIFTLASVILTIAHIARRRGWVWLAALVHGLSAYFIFFHLPFIPEVANEYLLFQATAAAILLLLPDLLLKPDWRARLGWFLPLRGLGAFVGLCTVFGIFGTALSDQMQAAITSFLLSGFYWLYAVRYRKAWLGYLPAFLLPLGLVYGFGALNLPFGFAAVAILSALYYGFGLALERFLRLEDWSKTLRWTGLTLILSLAVAALIGENRFEGWFIALLALAFLLESRRYPRIEIVAPALLAFGFVLVLLENDVWPEFYYLAGISALWLATEYIYKLLLPARPLALLTRFFGGWFGALTAAAFLASAGESPAQFIVSLVFAIFVLAYALLYRQPRLGYAFSLFLALAVLSPAILWLDSAWLWALAPLAILYFIFGLALNNPWGETFRFSGLGLAALTALSAPFAPQVGGGWFVAALGLPWLAETLLKKRPWAEGGFYLFGLLALGMVLYQYELLTPAYYFFGMAVFLLGFELIFGLGIARTPTLSAPIRILGGIAAGISILACIPDGIETGELVISLALTVFFGLYAVLRRQPALGYIPAGLLPLSVLFGLNWLGWSNWLWPLIAVAVGYYAASLLVGLLSANWSQVLRLSAIGLGTLTSLSAPFEGSGALASIPVAIAASLWAVEAFRRRNVWLGFPTNGLYLMSYFMLLTSLEVTQPQFYSIGAALLGLLMHYLLTRTGSDKGAFVTGLVSQLLLLGTTYIQMLATEELGYFAALFFQALAVLIYGLVLRSRSLVGVPVAMLVLGVSTVCCSSCVGFRRSS